MARCIPKSHQIKNLSESIEEIGSINELDSRIDNEETASLMTKESLEVELMKKKNHFKIDLDNEFNEKILSLAFENLKVEIIENLKNFLIAEGEVQVKISNFKFFLKNHGSIFSDEINIRNYKVKVLCFGLPNGLIFTIKCHTDSKIAKNFSKCKAKIEYRFLNHPDRCNLVRKTYCDLALKCNLQELNPLNGINGLVEFNYIKELEENEGFIKDDSIVLSVKITADEPVFKVN